MKISSIAHLISFLFFLLHILFMIIFIKVKIYISEKMSVKFEAFILLQGGIKDLYSTSS